jgi:cation-transporting P-type ATPase E
LAPNVRRYHPGFVRRVLRLAIPCGFVAASATFSSYAIARNIQDVSLTEARTTATLVLLVVGLWVLAILARPITPFRAALVGAMVGIFVLVLALPRAREFYALNLPPADALVGGIIIAGSAIALLEVGWTIVQRRIPAEDRVPRLAWRNPAAVAATASRAA